MSFFSRIGNVARQATQFGLPGVIGGLFGGNEPNPSDAAQGYLNRIPSEVGQYYQPFINRGNESYETSQPVYNQMTQNPNDFINNIMRNYTPSEGYKFKQKNLTQAARNSAAQGGFAGTPIAQMQEADIVNGLLSGDMQQFLQNILGVQGAGLTGQENRIGQGFQAGVGMGDIIGTNLGNQAEFGYQGQRQQNVNTHGRRNALLNFLSRAVGTAGGGGF